MKNIFRVYGIIALIAVIGFGTLSCDNGTTPDNTNQETGLQLPAYPEFNPLEIANTESDTDTSNVPAVEDVNDALMEGLISNASIYYMIKDNLVGNLIVPPLQRIFFMEGSMNEDISGIVSDTEYLPSGIDGLDGTATGSVQPTATGYSGNIELDFTYLCDSVDDTTDDWRFAFGESNPNPDYWMKATAKHEENQVYSETETSARQTLTLAITYLGSVNFPEYSGKFRFNRRMAYIQVATIENREWTDVVEPLTEAEVTFYDNDWNELYKHVYTEAELDAYDDLAEDYLQE